jgi:hypoxanthine phosphoribosyltransferase
MTEPGIAGTTFLSEEDLLKVVSRLGKQISEDHPSGVALVGVLKGGAVLMADLVRHISVPCWIDFLQLSSYSTGAPRVRLAKDIEMDVTDRPAVIVVELLDSGLTVNYVKRLLAERGARGSSVCALLDRGRRRVVPVEIAYRGLEIGDEYLVGYGLDLDERYRGLPFLWSVDRSVLHPTGENVPIASA